jgi:hypothetical protein
MSMFENRLLRTVFGPKNKVTGGLRKLYYEELHNFCSSLNTVLGLSNQSG